ncbi:MAG TPA: Crp/Fnr family transcriptional regulator [Anaerolineales bacterium]|nr:Crp/Fnr family transcriptional regulator [Anaerolineales bacterium]
MLIDPLKLRQVSVFQNATDDDLDLIAQHGIERSIEDGEFFFFQGDPAIYSYVLTAGRAKLMQMNANGQQVNLRTINEWQMFGALGAVRENAAYPASAQAMEYSTALAVKSEYLHELMQTRPYLAFDLMKLMTSYIQEMQERYRELATEKVERRIARALLRLTAQMGIKTPDGHIELAFTRQELAEISGTTLFTVSRVMSEWEKQGLVVSGRERVVIRNPHGLVQIAEESKE